MERRLINPLLVQDFEAGNLDAALLKRDGLKFLALACSDRYSDDDDDMHEEMELHSGHGGKLSRNEQTKRIIKPPRYWQHREHELVHPQKP